MVATDADRVRRALNSADFPAEKDDLVRYAEEADADQDTVRALRAIPPVSYANLTEVLRSVNVEPPRDPSDQAAQRRTHTHPGLSELDKDIPSNPIVDELGTNRGS
jgi:hypothetical protein